MGNFKNGTLKLVFAFITLPAVFCVQPGNIINPGVLTQSTSLGDCQACKLFIESFKNGLERTSRGKYEGGDAAWEEEKLKKSYKRSEMRLIDVQEGICKEKSKYSIQCHHMAEKAEEFIEEWWGQNPDESEDLFSYICIEKLQVCCPAHHYGKECTPCPGDHSKLCSGNGKCRGDGTRKGNGTCLCDPGYDGEYCSKCSLGHYQSYADKNKLLCSPCHMSCMGGCRAGTLKDCAACKPGFIFDSDEGCLDVNECDEPKKCKDEQFCMNSIGSFACFNCHSACNGCHGDGPDMCRKCANGYLEKGEFCVPEREGDFIESSETLTMTR